MRATPLALAALLVSLPLVAAAQKAAPGTTPPVEAPGAGQKLGSTTDPFTHDGKPLKLGDAVRLFNGKDTKGWKAFVPDLMKDGDPMSVWSVADGVLRCAGRPIGYIQTEELYDNYVLELEWRFDPEKGPGNSGVLLRTIGEDVVWPKSMEAQLHSRNAGDFWNIGEYQATVDAKRTNGRHTVKLHETNEKPLGEWNRYRIVVNGGTIELWVNGLLQNVATGVEVNKGRIALQSEGAYIEFRNIALRPIEQ
ncbi:MAG: hypothetical protein RLZZ238_2339 [Planctomycetota bacterium]|jgi:hypothetical protein